MNGNLIPNVSTQEGRELGSHLVRFFENALAGRVEHRPRCKTCAFRRGTDANGSPAATMDATKCLIERRPFHCHEDDRQNGLCAGYALLAKESGDLPGIAPWPYSDGSPE